MEKSGKLIKIIFFSIFGIVMGIQLNTMVSGDFTSPYRNEIEAQEMSDIRKTTEDMKIRIADFKNRVEELEQERVAESIPLKQLKATVDEYKFLAGYSPVSGPGVIIVLESNIETNIAEIIEGRKYLINLINELKVFGGEVISINNHRVVGRTEVTLAGNHININGVPVAQPYIIQAIGSLSSLERYIQHGTILFELMTSDGINSSVKFSDDIKILPLTREKPSVYLKVSEE